MADIETLQQSFMESMSSMQKSFDSQKKKLEAEIENLKNENKSLKEKNEQILKEKQTFEEFFKEEVKNRSEEINSLKKKNKELSLKSSTFTESEDQQKKKYEELKKNCEEEKKIYEEEKKIYEEKMKKIDEEKRKLEMETRSFEVKNKALEEEKKRYEDNNNQINLQRKNYEDKIKQLEEQLKEKTKESSEKIESLKNQFLIEEKLNKELKEKIEKTDEIMKEKDNNINQLNEDVKKKENKIHELYEYVKKLKENEEKLKIEEEKMKIEKEKFQQYKIEEEKRRTEENKKKKEEETSKNDQDKNNKNNEMNDEKKNKFLCDILCEFLLKLNNSQYFLTVFDLLNKCLKNYDELNYFNKMSMKYNQKINSLLFNFYTNLRSYIILNGQNSAFNNFLTQKMFKYSEIDKDDIEILKKIRTVKLGENNILDIYKKKKDLFFQKVGLTFDLLKDKILNDTSKINTNHFPDLLKLNKPPTELYINFDKMDVINLSPYISFQINNIFSKLEILSIELSKVNLDVFYSLLLNCLNLKSIKIVLKSKQNLTNVEILNNVIPIIFTYLKNITEFSYSNIMLLNKYLPEIVDSFKNSKLKKLTLNSCFTSKEDLTSLQSYFSGSNDLEEIEFSSHNINIPVLLSNSLLNYEVNKKLISINFNSCSLKDEDFETISQYVIKNNLLKYCNLGNNNISQKSCFKLGTMIEKTTSLEKLILNNCHITGETCLLLFNSKGSNTLKYLNINDNDIGDVGLVGISGFIKNSHKLEVFELENVSGNDMGFSTLINWVKIVGNIKEIHFERNQITKMSIDIIKGLNEEFKNNNIKFYVNKLDGEKDIDSLKFI